MHLPVTRGRGRRRIPTQTAARRRGGRADGDLSLRLGLGLLVAGVLYLFLLQGSAADPRLWLRGLPAHDAAALSRARETLENPLDRKVLDENLRFLDDPKAANAAIRRLGQLVHDRFPQLGPAVAGAFSRKAKLYVARHQDPVEGEALGQLAVNLGRAATAMAPEDWRLWLELEGVYRALGRDAEAAEVASQAETLRRARPAVTGADYAKGLGVPLGAVVLTLLVTGLGGGGPAKGAAASGPGPGAPPAATPDAAARAAKAKALGLDLDAPPDESVSGQGQITRVLGAEERLEQAKLLLEEGEWEDAIPVFQKAVQLNPALKKKVAAMLVVAGKRLYDQGQLDGAAQAFELAGSFDSNDIRAHTYLANCKVKSGDFSGATEHYLHVCGIDPQGAVGFYNLGICYEKTGDLPSAIKAFERALALDAKMANAHFYLGKIYEAQSALPQAAQHWRACFDLAPETAQGRRAQERLAALAQAGVS